MKAFSLKPSRLVGEIKRALEAAVESGEIAPHMEAEAYVEIVGKDRARFGLPPA
jgi:poly(A) polymerase